MASKTFLLPRSLEKMLSTGEILIETEKKRISTLLDIFHGFILDGNAQNDCVVSNPNFVELKKNRCKVFTTYLNDITKTKMTQCDDKIKKKYLNKSDKRRCTPFDKLLVSFI